MKNDQCEVSFYHLSRYPVVKVLPKLLEKIYQAENRCLVLCRNDQEMKDLNDVLWTYASRAFLPHGSTIDPNPEVQPILLSIDAKNLNSAKIILVLSGIIPDNIHEFERCLDLFCDTDGDDVVAQARKRYKFYKDNNYPLTYWTQNAEGGWIKN
jgi:DNA polymerase-3 subunit chi